MNVILNFGDIIIPTNIPQIYLFDWAYAVYPESIVWKHMELKEYIIRKTKILLIKKYIKLPKLILAQTNTIKKRLTNIYGVKQIEIVPNAVSINHLESSITKNYYLPKNKIKLLYLTRYYTHKNLEIFIPLAKKIKDMNLPYVMIITVEKYQHKNAKSLINKINKRKLNDTIINVGNVELEDVPSLYLQCDALLMPTLLESFSGTYLEAMYQGKTILTSDLDFAHQICGNAAYYFNPLNVESILKSIEEGYSNESLRNNKLEIGKRRLSEFPNWEKAFSKYQSLIQNIIEGV